MGSDVIQVLLAMLPAMVVGAVTYLFFHVYVRDREGQRRYDLVRESHKELIPFRIQALERMTLFLERIDPGNLLLRIKPGDMDNYEYQTELIRTIEQEFEHNITQQIYVSNSCWDAIRSAKNATISMIRAANASEDVTTPDKLREVILTEMVKNPSPSYTGLEYIKKEAREMW